MNHHEKFLALLNIYEGNLKRTIVYLTKRIKNLFTLANCLT